MPDAVNRLPTPPRHTLEAIELTRHFGGIVAVHEVSFHVERGELIGLIGPNGSGKTTLVNLLSGAIEPDSGAIRLDGHLMNGRPPHEFARRGIARTFQVPRLFRRMTVMQNLMVPALTGATAARRAARQRVEEILEFLNLSALAHDRARTLSGGQQKLLELGRALMLNPTVLYLDEPFAGVHPRLLDQIVDRITRLNERGRTIVIVDHNLDAIRRVVERRLLVMARGNLIADGAPEAVLANPAVVAAYTGS